MSYFGLRSFVHTQASPDSVQLPTKTGTESLAKLIAEEVPELREGAYDYLSPVLFNGDLQTLYAGAGNFENVNKIYYGRRIIAFPEESNSIVSADYLIPPPASKEEWTKLLAYSPLEKTPPYPARTRYLRPEEVAKYERTYTPEDKPLLVLLHGLSGGSHESYIRAVIDDIKSKFDCVVLNSRGCARTPITTPQLFCAIWTEDIRRFVQILHKEQPGRRIYLIGFSLGASILANYLGQQGDLARDDPANKIDGAIIVANPWDLAHSNQAMHSSYIGSHVYSPVMTKNLVRLLKNHKDVLAQNPNFDYEKRLSLKYIYDFDDAFTAPLFGFDSAKDYYRSASSVHRILGIRVPTVTINALDDPIVHKDCIPYKEAIKNPYILLATTSLGGHIGWFKRGNQLWYPPVITKIFSALDSIDHTKGVPKAPVSQAHRQLVDGRLQLQFLTEKAPEVDVKASA
ncbi:uncharacterized protein SAPINGB_P002890 [Magnusiomyces paraingens]|uniref:AB hydrolase-1 domain-containing protein n=1 Tax=Magnusiomyces paraingens TaxID=2606893 RepID=A0A5E8BMB5_9ASCO|nr:uncharacterized protein SAPINGB_P002890 [Saprochaete ingens]VVT50818.1 unnamed protein product [Saprochaete ingens]